MRQEQPDGTGPGVKDGAGIAAGILTVIPHNLRLRPGIPAVEAPLQKQINVAGIAAAFLATLAKRKQGALRRRDQGRDTIRMVAILARDKQRRLLRFAGSPRDCAGENGKSASPNVSENERATEKHSQDSSIHGAGSSRKGLG
jgi:hypothetical protein